MEENKIFKKLNLQLFADGGEGDNDNGAEGDKKNKDKENNNQNTDNNKTFTQADFDREISKMYEKFEEKFNKRAATAKLEAEKLANMNAEERLKYEIEQREKAIADKEKEWTLKENKYECSKILSEKGLPIAFADFVVAEDADTMQKNINLFDSEFKKAVKVEIEKRLSSTTPKTGTLGLDGQITKEQFNKMTISQQNELFKNNKELYMELSK